MHKILVVEDNRELNRAICLYLNQRGFSSTGCLDAKQAYDELYENVFDVIVSDIMMPEIDGFEFAESVRAINKEIPILFITAKDDFFSMQRSYEIGIDDYMTKPINLDELFLRIGALLRRAKIASSKKLEIGSLILNDDEKTAYLDGEEVRLSLREFNLLYKLLSYPQKAFSRAHLMEEFWDANSESSSRSVDMYIVKLREKFSDCKDFEILTVHGLGYKAVLK